MFNKPTAPPSSLEEKSRRDIFQSTPIAVYEVYFPGNKFKFVNEKLCQLLGYSEEELFALNPNELLFDEGKVVIQQMVEEALRGENLSSSSAEIRVKAKNGQSHWGLITAKVNLKLGKPDTVLIFAQDITERKKIEEDLRESEERFSTAFRNNPAAMAISNIEGQIVDANDSFEHLLGYTKHEIIGKVGCSTRLYSSSERKRLIDKLNEKGRVSNFEMTFRHKSGKQINVLFSLEPITLNKKTYSLGTAIDNTERKKAEEALREAEEKFRSLVESTTDMIWQVDDNAVYTYVSPKVKDILGYEPEEVVGKTPFDLIDEEDEEKIMHAFLEIANKKEPFYGLENWNVHKNGSRVLLETSGVPVLAEGGQLAGYRGIDRDITDRKQAEEDLARSKQRITDILSSIDEVIFSLDSNWRVIYASNKAATIAGFKPQELVGKCFWDYSKVFVDTLVDKSFREAMKKHETRSFEWRNQLTKGFTAFTVFPSSEGITVYGEDITERKRLQQELENYTKDLEKIVEERTHQLQEKERLAAIGATAGMVGHDIRNPLQSIVCELYLAREELQVIPNAENRERMKESIDAIESQVFYINKIVADLQDFTKLLAPKRQTVDLMAIVRESLSSVMMPENVTVSMQTVDRPAKVFVDPLYLKRILVNLFSNALQAMPSGGKLSITARFADSEAEIIVKDTGGGIPDEIKPQIFQPLFTTKAKGQGLGLAVVKRLTEALDGSVTFESQVGKGTSFTVKLPLEKQESA